MELFLAFPLAGGTKTAGGEVDACSSLPLCLPRPLPCPFLLLPRPLSGVLLLPLPLAMSGSERLKSLPGREWVSCWISCCPWSGRTKGSGAWQLQLEVPKGHYVREERQVRVVKG